MVHWRECQPVAPRLAPADGSSHHDDRGGRGGGAPRHPRLVSPTTANDTGDYLTVAHMIGRLDFPGWNGARTPGFPIVVWAVRYNLRALEVTQQVLGVVGAVLIERTLRRVGATSGTSLIGGLVYAVSPVVLLAETNVLTEAVSMFAVVVVLALVSVIDAELDDNRHKSPPVVRAPRDRSRLAGPYSSLHIPCDHPCRGDTRRHSPTANRDPPPTTQRHPLAGREILDSSSRVRRARPVARSRGLVPLQRAHVWISALRAFRAFRSPTSPARSRTGLCPRDIDRSRTCWCSKRSRGVARPATAQMPCTTPHQPFNRSPGCEPPPSCRDASPASRSTSSSTIRACTRAPLQDSG